MTVFIDTSSLSLCIDRGIPDGLKKYNPRPICCLRHPISDSRAAAWYIRIGGKRFPRLPAAATIKKRRNKANFALTDRKSMALCIENKAISRAIPLRSGTAGKELAVVGFTGFTLIS